MTYANNLDPDEAPQNVGLHLRSKLFDIQIIYQKNVGEETLLFLHLLKEKKYLKKLPSMQRDKVKTIEWSITDTRVSFMAWSTNKTHLHVE